MKWLMWVKGALKFGQKDSNSCRSSSGVLSQETKNKTYTSKNICSNASKDRSLGEYLA